MHILGTRFLFHHALFRFLLFPYRVLGSTLDMPTTGPENYKSAPRLAKLVHYTDCSYPFRYVHVYIYVSQTDTRAYREKVGAGLVQQCELTSPSIVIIPAVVYSRLVWLPVCVEVGRGF